MNDSVDTKAIQQKLEEEQKQLVARIADLSAQDPFTDTERANDNSGETDANEESSHDRFAAMVSELQDKVDAIGSALSRIADGTYGTCSSCGNPIEPQRLAILPTATLCLSCEAQKKK